MNYTQNSKSYYFLNSKRARDKLEEKLKEQKLDIPVDGNTEWNEIVKDNGIFYQIRSKGLDGYMGKTIYSKHAEAIMVMVGKAQEFPKAVIAETFKTKFKRNSEKLMRDAINELIVGDFLDESSTYVGPFVYLKRK